MEWNKVLIFPDCCVRKTVSMEKRVVNPINPAKFSDGIGGTADRYLSKRENRKHVRIKSKIVEKTEPKNPFPSRCICGMKVRGIPKIPKMQII